MKKWQFVLAGVLVSLNAFAAPMTVDVKTLPMDLSFERVKGDGSRNMYIFCDLDCPHCQRTESFLHSLDNVKIHTFVMPVASYHPDAPRKTNAIWCSEDKVKAWQDWYDMRALPADAKDCAAPLEKIDEYAHGQGIYLPAVIFEDGTTYTAEDFIYATRTPEMLQSLLDEHSAKKK